MLGLLLAILLTAPVMAQESPEEKLEIRNLGTCGLVTRYASSQINDVCLTRALNVYLDEDAGISRRGGFAKYNTTAISNTKSVRGMWEFRANDGTEYMVVLSSQSMFSSNGQGAFSVISGLNNLSATQDMDCAQCLGKLWCVNGSDTMFSWDGSSTDTVSTAPTCQVIDCFRNRVVLGNCSGTLSQLRMSGELDGTDYTIPTTAVSTSPASISIGGVNDGNRLVGIMGVYQDVLVLGKEDSTHGLYGFDRDDFTVREISREVGLVDNRSAREKQGSLYWLSKRGVEKMTGPSITRVSDPVRDLIDTIIVAGGNSRSATDTSQTDFEAGNLSASGAGAKMSATISPFNVVPGTFTITDASTGAYLSGTLVNLSTIPLSGSLVMTGNIYNVGGENGDTTTNWDSRGWELGTGTDYYGYRYWTYTGNGTCPASWRFAVKNTSDVDILTQTGQITDQQEPIEYSIDTSTLSETQVKFYFRNFTTIAKEDLTNAFAKPSVIRIKVGDGNSNLGECVVSYDIDEQYSTGTYTSQIYNTGFSTPIGGVFSATTTISGSESFVFFDLRYSSSPYDEAWSSWAPTSDTLRISAPSQYWQYRGRFSTLVSSKTPSFGGASLTGATTGYFISQCQNPGTAITSWGLFQCNSVPNSGDITFQVSTGPTCHSVGVATAPWTTQTNNTILNIATAPYVAYRVLFNIDAASETLTLNDCTINWNDGTSRPSVSAEVYRERYYLAYTSGTSGTVANDHIAVLDSRDQWVLHDAPNCSALGIYNRKLYCGDSGATGRVYLVDSGHDDDGSAFSSAIRTKDFDMGNVYQKKILKRMYFDMAGIPDQSYLITLTPSYTIDASTDTFSLSAIDLNEDYSRFIAPKVPASLDYNTTGRWFNFGLENSGTQGPWKVYGIRATYQRLTED